MKKIKNYVYFYKYLNNLFNLAIISLLLVLLFHYNAFAEDIDKDQYVVMISIDGFGWDWYWQNSKVKIPTLRELAAGGSVGSMEVSFPSVTWASHTSIMTGAFPRESGVIGNSIYNRKLSIKENLIGDDIFDKDSFIKIDTVYDYLKKNSKGKLTTAAISWPITRGSKHLDYIVPESYTQSTYFKSTKPANFLEELSKNGISVNRWGDWSELSESYRQDWLTADAAKYLIKNKKPNLLMMHFLVTDSFSHLYGAGSEESIWAHEYVDKLISDIITVLKDENIYDKTTILIVSDHGWTNITKAIKANVILKLQGFLKEDNDGRVIYKDAISIMNHGVAFIYILNDDKGKVIENDIYNSFQTVEGVKAVYKNSDFYNLGLPDPKNNEYMPDLVVEAKQGYYFVDDHTGMSPLGDVQYVATHGHDPKESWMYATLIASGPNINKGKQLQDITVRDITPTILNIFGYSMPNQEQQHEGKYRPGRVLTELFEK